eukprot:PhF_6_TR34220/c0_g1_i2/m.50195
MLAFLVIFWMGFTSPAQAIPCVITEVDNFCNTVNVPPPNCTTSWEVSLTMSSITMDETCSVIHPIQIKCMPLPSSIQYHFLCQANCVNIDLTLVREWSLVSFDGCKFYGGGIEIKESFYTDVVIINSQIIKPTTRNLGLSSLKSVLIENCSFRDSLNRKIGGGGCLMITDIREFIFIRKAVFHNCLSVFQGGCMVIDNSVSYTRKGPTPKTELYDVITENCAAGHSDGGCIGIYEIFNTTILRNISMKNCTLPRLLSGQGGALSFVESTVEFGRTTPVSFSRIVCESSYASGVGCISINTCQGACSNVSVEDVHVTDSMTDGDAMVRVMSMLSSISGLVCKNLQGGCLKVTGGMEANISNVVLKNVKTSFTFCVRAHTLTNLKMKNVSVESCEWNTTLKPLGAAVQVFTTNPTFSRMNVTNMEIFDPRQGLAVITTTPVDVTFGNIHIVSSEHRIYHLYRSALRYTNQSLDIRDINFPLLSFTATKSQTLLYKANSSRLPTMSTQSSQSKGEGVIVAGVSMTTIAYGALG